jgi:hypothetical protein
MRRMSWSALLGEPMMQTPTISLRLVRSPACSASSTSWSRRALDRAALQLRNEYWDQSTSATKHAYVVDIAAGHATNERHIREKRTALRRARLQRFIDERLPPLTEVALAASALAELRHGNRNAGMEALKRLRRHG